MPLPYLPMIVIAAGFPVLLCTFAAFDRLVRTEYEINRGAWEADGRPSGFFWRAPECTPLRSRWEINRLSLLWLFTTPAWAIDSPRCQMSFRGYRLWVVGWTAFVALFVIVFLAIL